MPNYSPTLGQVHVDRPLTNLSIAYIQEASDFVASQVFPVVTVDKKSDTYFTYNHADFRRSTSKKRAPGTESAAGGYSIDHTGQYNCQNLALHRDVSDEEFDNADAPLAPLEDSALYLTQQQLIGREKDWVSNYFTNGLWTFDYTGVASAAGTNEAIQWSDYTNSDPIRDVANALLSVKTLTGFMPNTLVLSLPVYMSLKDHPDIIDRVKYVQPIGINGAVIISPSALTQLFFNGLVPDARVIIASATEETQVEGGTTSISTASMIAGKSALLCYSNRNRPTIRMPSAGYTFSWRSRPAAGPEGNFITQFYMRKLKATRVEAEMYYDHKQVSADLGFFWKNIVA